MNFIEKFKLIFNHPGIYKIRTLQNYYWHWRDLKNKPLSKKAELISIQIEPTSRCNLRCKMCQHSFDQMQKKDMTLSQFVHILNQMPFLVNLTLQGLGEPFLNKEIFEMIKETKKRNIRIGLSTNATLITKEIAQKIIDSGLDWMYLSLDSLNKEIYEDIRRGANFDLVINNIKNFFELKGNRKPDTNFWVLIMKENLTGIPKIIEFAEELGMNKVVLQNNIHNWGHDNFKKNMEQIKNSSNEELLSLIENIKKIKNNVNIEMCGNNKECNWPWRSTYITCDGYITPCCMQGSDPEIINFGNIFKNSIEEILNNKNYQKFRNNSKNGPIPEVCVNCPAYRQQEIIKI